MHKTIMIRLSFVAFSLILSACSSQLRSVTLGAAVDPEVAPGKVFTSREYVANVGAVMLDSEEYLKDTSVVKYKVFRVKDSVRASVKHKLKTFHFFIPSGDYLLHSRTAFGNYYSAPKAFMGLNGTNTGYGGLFVPNKESEATEFYWNWSPNSWKAYQAKLPSKISGSTEESIKHLNASKKPGPRATLTYIGVAAGQIRFAYKEFTEEGLARPAFTQEVILDYKQGGTYAYKNAQFTVEEADSTRISFTLLRPL